MGARESMDSAPNAYGPVRIRDLDENRPWAATIANEVYRAGVVIDESEPEDDAPIEVEGEEDVDLNEADQDWWHEEPMREENLPYPRDPEEYLTWDSCLRVWHACIGTLVFHMSQKRVYLSRDPIPASRHGDYDIAPPSVLKATTG
eukprot:6457715-Amphidinium_carterae.2